MLQRHTARADLYNSADKQHSSAGESSISVFLTIVRHPSNVECPVRALSLNHVMCKCCLGDVEEPMPHQGGTDDADHTGQLSDHIHALCSTVSSHRERAKLFPFGSYMKKSANLGSVETDAILVWTTRVSTCT